MAAPRVAGAQLELTDDSDSSCKACSRAIAERDSIVPKQQLSRKGARVRSSLHGQARCSNKTDEPAPRTHGTQVSALETMRADWPGGEARAKAAGKDANGCCTVLLLLLLLLLLRSP